MNNNESLESGNRVQHGQYACTQCDPDNIEVAQIEKDNDKLPDCPKCGYSYWIKI